MGARILVSEALAAYLKHHAAHMESIKSREFARDTSRQLLLWWTAKRVEEVNGANCRAFVRWRCEQKYRGRNISVQSARHDLKTLKAALNFYKREIDPSLVVPAVTMPPAAPPRVNYFLTREEVAARIRAARRGKRTRHVARVILIGFYSGTRPGAVLSLSWLPSSLRGWIDLEAGVLHRRGFTAKVTNKRQPPARIHRALLSHLKRWQRIDMERDAPITSVISYQGEQLAKLRRSWKTVANLARAMTKEAAQVAGFAPPEWAVSTREDGPHIMRHTCCTWLMAAGVDVFEVAGYTGASVKTLLEVYAHHHPAFQSHAATAGKRTRNSKAIRQAGTR